MQTTGITHVAHLVELCAQSGMKQVVVSPGSRNAPLVIAFDSHPNFELILIHDERCAAFFAMGLAEESGLPVAITCTSGSAPLNYAPAISEAYYRNIPLLVLTADRPVDLIDKGIGQTIRQKNVYQNYIKASFELPDFPDREARSESDRLVAAALKVVSELPKGPVHVNIPLAEPLYEIQTLTEKPILPKYEHVSNALIAKECQEIEEVWEQSKRKMIVIGQLEPNKWERSFLMNVLDDPSVAVLVENTSNIQHFPKVVHCIDRTLAIIPEEALADFVPDLIVRIGGAIISKKIKALFRDHPPKHNWNVGLHLVEEEPFGSLTASFRVSPRKFFECVNTFQFPPNSNFGSVWKQADFNAEMGHFEFLETCKWSDLKAVELILDTVPDDANIHMANSSVVRYGQLFNPTSTLSYYSNRGVSGIDGSTSTAAGVAYANSGKLNLLISGDISFFYDSNALWNQANLENLRIMVIRNGGGGIFQIIDGPSSSNQSDYFHAPFSASVAHLCETFGAGYVSVDSEASFLAALPSFYAQSGDRKPKVMELQLSGIESATILKSYFRFIAD